jgi:hypothetical protein
MSIVMYGVIDSEMLDVNGLPVMGSKYLVYIPVSE